MVTVAYQGEGAFKDPSTPNIDESLFQAIDLEKLGAGQQAAPKFLILYGSLRAQSYSRMLAEEAARILIKLGGEVKFFDPRGLPQAGEALDDEGQTKVEELVELALWADGHVWVSPERHGNFTAVLKNQIDQIPLSMGAVRPTQGRALAVMQVCGGSQSFNSVNNLRILGRWMRMLTIPNQSAIAKAYEEFDDNGRMKPSGYYNRVVDVMVELVKFTYLVKDKNDYLVERYSEAFNAKAQG